MCTTYCSAIIVLAGITRFLSFCTKEAPLPASRSCNKHGNFHGRRGSFIALYHVDERPVTLSVPKTIKNSSMKINKVLDLVSNFVAIALATEATGPTVGAFLVEMF
jgi:hypothetical protein